MGLEDGVVPCGAGPGGWTKLRSWGTIFLASSWGVIRAHSWSRADSVAQKYSADISATRMAVVGLHDRQSRRFSTWRNSGRTEDLIELKCRLLTGERKKKEKKKSQACFLFTALPRSFLLYSPLAAWISPILVEEKGYWADLLLRCHLCGGRSEHALEHTSRVCLETGGVRDW